ncbi:sugar kinase [Streptomyces griseoloalbus]|uniref:2-dehydro-3-deoxygluconokinase n=1 Tax=Streptomyces griseoloalbus TaxID=67303 RepID=A0A7W8BJ72_9ACTN|nr:sugar kinase [Streptomyces albaduncus]MBB5124375.1 2-dehydro-3-deoxygluconokinase [Streptomyces albaduncus]GGW64533.1 carbohydrate kinase [Streptomyces albaduncus]
MTVTGSRNAPDVVDVVALGESMVTFLPSRPGRLADVPSFDRGIGGAESNVACVLAAAGHTTRWVSRVGADGFGDHLVEAIGGYGVDVSYVRRDPDRPTGVYFRTAGDRAGDAHEVAYYRAGSAASAMTAAGVDLEAVRAGRVLHLSGITAALSADCLDLMRELTAPRPGRPLVSFDVNHRPGLWRDGPGPGVLLELARAADIVFVGEDEAESAWGIDGDPSSLREALPEPDILVVKQGARGAVAFGPAADSPGTRGGPTARGGTPPTPGRAPRPRPAASAPALAVDVVATTGAGDAFAAGFLSATLRGLPVRERLRHGHLTAAAALTAPGDLAAPPARALADRLAALDDTAWGRLRLGPGWTQADEGADEEVRTP